MKKILISIFLIIEQKSDEDICPQIKGLDSPVDIFQVYFNSFYNDMLPSQNSNLELIKVTEQIIDVWVYRFLFKYQLSTGKVNYVGVLSVITPSEQMQQKPKHQVVRFIQSSDFRDAQRLLGVYDADPSTPVKCDCDLKKEFWDEVAEHPLPYQNPSSIKQSVNKVVPATGYEPPQNYSNPQANLWKILDNNNQQREIQNDRANQIYQQYRNSITTNQPQDYSQSSNQKIKHSSYHLGQILTGQIIFHHKFYEVILYLFN